MEGPGASNFTIYMIFLIAVLLVALDTLQLYNIYLSWKIGLSLNEQLFSSCIKFNLLSKTAFGIFSFLASVSLTSLCFLFIYNPDYFVEKVFYTYIRINYQLFGPIMLCFSIIGLYYFSDICYVCYDKRNLNAKRFSVNNCFSLLMSFVISLSITLISEIYMSIFFIINSITNKPGGQKWVKRVFYKLALRN